MEQPPLQASSRPTIPPKKSSSHLGVEPRTFGLEVQRAIHCANGTTHTWLEPFSPSLRTCGPFFSYQDVLASAVHILKLERYRED